MDEREVLSGCQKYETKSELQSVHLPPPTFPTPRPITLTFVSNIFTLCSQESGGQSSQVAIKITSSCKASSQAKTTVVLAFTLSTLTPHSTHFNFSYTVLLFYSFTVIS